jgi:hypothetical protein
LVIGFLLVCSLAVNLLLARRVSSLRRTINIIKSERQLAEGDIVPSITAKDLQGQTVTLD